jgi:hypothetical protein
MIMTDLPFRVREPGIVIVKGIPVWQCDRLGGQSANSGMTSRAKRRRLSQPRAPPPDPRFFDTLLAHAVWIVPWG